MQEGGRGGTAAGGCGTVAAMSENACPRTTKWPFIVGDLVLVATAGGVAALAHGGFLPWTGPTVGIVVAAVAAGAWILITPFLRDQEAALKQMEQAGLADTLRQVRQLEQAAAGIASGAALLQAGQQALDRSRGAAEAMTEVMISERKNLAELQSRTFDQERQTLRIEVEKLRRNDEEAVRVLCHLLDHNYAVFQAGQRSGQAALAQQLAQYRAACLDAVRRLGLVAHEAQPGEAFNPEVHQTADGQPPVEGAQILGTIACGYSLRGAGIRPIIVAAGPVEAAGGGNPPQAESA